MRIALPGCLAALLLWQVASGRIYVYIHDRSVWLLVLSIPVLAAFALLAARRGPARTSRAMSVVALPLVLALLIPAHPLGSAALETAGSPRTRGTLADLSVPLSIDTRDRVWDLKQLGLLQDRQPDLRQLDGQRADVLGFVHRLDSTPRDQFIVGRFVVRCCTADAIAFSLPVSYTNSAELSRDSWVEVRGTLRASDSAVILQAESLQLVPQPTRPYLQLP